MNKEKTIYCPKCGRRVSHYDGRGTMNIMATCRKCRKRVVYDVSNDKTKLTDIPQRETSSGMIFY
jgi:hypothetical protein